MKLDIDFTQHPAFASFVEARGPETVQFKPILAEAEAIADEIYDSSAGDSTLESRWAAYDSRVQPLRKRFDQGMEEDKGIDRQLAPLMSKHFRTAIKEYAIEREYMLGHRKPDFSLSRAAHEGAEEMDAVGYKLFQMPDRWLRPLCDFLQPDIDRLRASIQAGETELVRTDGTNLTTAIVRDYCESAGIFDILAALYGRRFGKMGFTLHVSHPGDEWYHTFDDVGLPVPRTTQMHYDLAYDVPKILLYLNDVSTEQGPFSVIPGSHKWEDSGLWLTYRKEITLALSDYLKAINAPPLGANVSRFRRVEARKAFASLPAELRNTGHFGDLVMDGSALSDALLEKEVPMTGPKGTMGLFTGCKVLHRGGLVQKGERWAIQVCFWPEEAVKLPKKEQLQAQGLVAKASPDKPKKGIFSKIFPGLGKPEAAPAPASKPAGATDKPKAPPAAKPFSHERFGRGLKQILGGDLRLSLVDVGGAVNLQPHWHKMHQVADFTVYEPHPRSYQELVDRQKTDAHYAGFRYINEALSGTGGPRTLYCSNVPTGSSLLPPKKNGIADHPGNTYLYPVREESLQTTTLKESLSSAGVSQVHGIKLDTQGTELEILQGLGSELTAGLVFVEMEIGVVERYDAPSANLETVLPWMREQGFELFDFRTNRFHGNAQRLPGGVKEVTDFFGCHKSSPGLAQRLNEVDAIFFRDPRLLIDGGTDAHTIRRLIAALCTYNLFGEALYTVRYAAEKGIIDSPASDSIQAALRQLHSEACLEVPGLDAALARSQYQNWGQYIWVPYPSA
mgnify:CR=1 FL=1